MSARAIAVAVVLACAGCAEMETAGRQAGEHLRNQFEVAARGGKPAPYRSVAGTEPLAGVFKRHPVTDSSRPPLWPKAAITFRAAPRYALQGGYFQFAQPKPTDCVVFDVRLWHDAQRSERFEGLKLCADAFEALQGMNSGPLMLWPDRQAWPFERNSGSQRSDGPLRPTTNAPGDPWSSRWFKTGTPFMPFMMVVLYQMGYDWNDLHDRRVWIVSVPPAP